MQSKEMGHFYQWECGSEIHGIHAQPTQPSRISCYDDPMPGSNPDAKMQQTSNDGRSCCQSEGKALAGFPPIPTISLNAEIQIFLGTALSFALIKRLIWTLYMMCKCEAKLSSREERTGQGQHLEQSDSAMAM